MEEEILQEVQEIQDAIARIKPEWGSFHHGKCHEGKGFVTESIFVVERHRIFWVVLLNIGTFAFKEVSPEWLEIFGVVITSSPTIFVEFVRHHRIVEWAASQPKVLPIDKP